VQPIKTAGLILALTLCGARAAAQELDSLLPDGIPGYGTAFSVVLPNHKLPAPALGLQWGGVTARPNLALQAGYDSAPNGTAGSSLLSLNPTLLVTNPLWGMALFASASTSAYPQNPSQNTRALTLAGGGRIALPDQSITLSGGYLQSQESGFALDALSTSKPAAFSVASLRGSDDILAGSVMLKPELSFSNIGFAAYPAQNHAGWREAITLTTQPDAPASLVLRALATQSHGRVADDDGATIQWLAGFDDSASALWSLSALAGVAHGTPRGAKPITAPVLEARLDWAPTELDQLRLSATRELDNPDEISAAPATITSLTLLLTHEYLTSLVFKLSAQVTNAANMDNPLRETIYNFGASGNWQFGASLGLAAAYAFNHRQANLLRTANEHVVTLGVTWTP